jgi:hypothetical protein
MRLVRVVAPHFVAAFETDGVIRRTAPILKRLLGENDETARKVIDHYRWQASVIAEYEPEKADPAISDCPPRV